MNSMMGNTQNMSTMQCEGMQNLQQPSMTQMMQYSPVQGFSPLKTRQMRANLSTPITQSKTDHQGKVYLLNELTEGWHTY